MRHSTLTEFEAISMPGSADCAGDRASCVLSAPLASLTFVPSMPCRMYKMSLSRSRSSKYSRPANAFNIHKVNKASMLDVPLPLRQACRRACMLLCASPQASGAIVACTVASAGIRMGETRGRDAVSAVVPIKSLLDICVDSAWLLCR